MTYLVILVIRLGPLLLLTLIAIGLYRKQQRGQLEIRHLGYLLCALSFPVYFITLYQYETQVPGAIWDDPEKMRRFLERREGHGRLNEYLSTAIVFFGPALWWIVETRHTRKESPTQ